MKLNDQFESVAREMEALDDEFRTHGIPERFKEQWNVSHNVGVWNVPRSTAEFLYQLILIKRPKLIVELGTSIGYSTIWLAAAAKEVGSEVLTIEIESYKVESASEYISRAGVADAVRQIHGNIGEVLDGFEERTDFVFMDANKRSYLEYIKKMEPYLNPGAVVVADNVMDMRDKVEDYLEYVSTDEKYSSHELEMDHGLMISVKK